MTRSLPCNSTWYVGLASKFDSVTIWFQTCEGLRCFYSSQWVFVNMRPVKNVTFTSREFCTKSCKTSWKLKTHCLILSIFYISDKIIVACQFCHSYHHCGSTLFSNAHWLLNYHDDLQYSLAIYLSDDILWSRCDSKFVYIVRLITYRNYVHYKIGKYCMVNTDRAIY